MSKKWNLLGLGVVVFAFVFGSTLVADCGQKKTVKIAFVGPLTGGNAAVGKGAKNSFELKVSEVLAKGDYPYDVQIVNEDDASDPATGVAAATKVGSDPDVVAAATHWNSPVGLATVHVFNKFGLAQLFWGTIHADIIYGNTYKGKVRLIPTSKDSNDRASTPRSSSAWAGPSSTTRPTTAPRTGTSSRPPSRPRGASSWGPSA
jgi:branched-chain amino acid transport system substrate-binding protein